MWQSVVLCSISLKEIQIYFPIRSENRLSIELWVELVEDLCFKDWMRVDDSGWISGEENRKPTLLYSTRSLEDWRGGELFLFYFTRWVKYCIDQQRVHTKCYSSLSPIFLNMTNACLFLINNNISGCFSWIIHLYCWNIGILLFRDKEIFEIRISALFYS